MKMIFLFAVCEKSTSAVSVSVQVRRRLRREINGKVWKWNEKFIFHGRRKGVSESSSYDWNEHKTCVLSLARGKCHNKAIKSERGLACLISDLIFISEMSHVSCQTHVSIATRCEIDNFSFQTSLFVSRGSLKISSSFFFFLLDSESRRWIFSSSSLLASKTFPTRVDSRNEISFLLMLIPIPEDAFDSFISFSFPHFHSRRAHWLLSMQCWIRSLGSPWEVIIFDIHCASNIFIYF